MLTCFGEAGIRVLLLRCCCCLALARTAVWHWAWWPCTPCSHPAHSQGLALCCCTPCPPSKELWGSPACKLAIAWSNPGTKAAAMHSSALFCPCKCAVQLEEVSKGSFVSLLSPGLSLLLVYEQCFGSDANLEVHVRSLTAVQIVGTDLGSWYAPWPDSNITSRLRNYDACQNCQWAETRAAGGKNTVPCDSKSSLCIKCSCQIALQHVCPFLSRSLHCAANLHSLTGANLYAYRGGDFNLLEADFVYCFFLALLLALEWFHEESCIQIIYELCRGSHHVSTLVLAECSEFRMECCTRSSSRQMEMCAMHEQQCKVPTVLGVP